MKTFFNRRLAIQFGAVLPALALAFVLACTGEGTAKEKPNYIFKEGQGPSGIAASIDGKNITEDELIGDERLEFADALKKLYDLRMDRLGSVLLEKEYSEAAKKANQTLEEYIEKSVLKGEPKVSDKEIAKFVADKQIPKDQVPQLKDRITNFMKAQKRQEEVQDLKAKISKKHKVEVYFPKPNLKVAVEAGNSPFAGSKSAKVTVVEFSDFQCPYCSKAAATVNEVKKAYGNKIQLVFKHFPLPPHMHPQAQPSAEASMCVHEQSADKFWKFHDLLFKNQEKLDKDSLKKYAKEVGVNLEKFNQCFDGGKFTETVKADLAYGTRLGVKSTPTFFINGRLISGAQPMEAFKEIIDEELKN